MGCLTMIWDELRPLSAVADPDSGRHDDGNWKSEIGNWKCDSYRGRDCKRLVSSLFRFRETGINSFTPLKRSLNPWAFPLTCSTAARLTIYVRWQRNTWSYFAKCSSDFFSVLLNTRCANSSFST